MEVNRPRTQADRSAATRGALVDAARRLFAADGFAGVGTEAIVREAGVTRGALYHQFADKTELFAAVFEAIEVEVTRGIGERMATAGVSDPLEALALGADAWLDACREPEMQQIVLLDAPAVLGWDRWRAIGQEHAMGLVVAALTAAMQQERIPEQPVRPLAHLLIGALDEAALYVARAEDQETARDEVRAVVGRLIEGLARAT